jgi:hypothetical protein
MLSALVKNYLITKLMKAKMKLLNKIKTKFAALLQISLNDWLARFVG